MKNAAFPILLVIAALAVPAAVPASQPANIRLGALAAAPVTVTEHRATLLADPKANGTFSIEMVTGYTTLEWIDQDPFAL